jgi:hypothetical protein
MAKVFKWRMEYGHKEPVKFVFDQMSKGKGEINAVFEEALKEGDEKALLHGISRDVGWSFESRDTTLPLQAADIFAWETLHYMQKLYLTGLKEPVRKSYTALIEISDRGYHNRESLREFVAEIKDRTGGMW